MPKISVYFPNDLHSRAVQAGLPISKICQAALAEAVADNAATLPELLDRQRHNIERIIEIYELRRIELFKRIAATGLDPLEVFEGLRDVISPAWPPASA